ncbi:MAG: hypothetical protein KIT22_15850, partial [Verrucomicrobiae bacterium]|nr:hypothetical protein [Verrucomicrobiae bacterium]
YESGWERSLTGGDSTNRFHLVLAASQVTPNSMLRLTSDFSSGGTQIGSTSLGFGDHDLVIRFRNQSGLSTVLFSGRLSAKSNVVVQIPLSNVSASAGANTVEYVRTGPTESGYSYSLGFDFVRVEVDGGGNQPPVFPTLGPLIVNEMTTLNADVSARDNDTPAAQLVHTLISGPSGLSVTTSGQLSWTPGETLGGTTNTVIIRATDQGIPPMSSTNTILIVVREVNLPPVLPVPATPTVDSLTPLSIVLAGSDPDLPVNELFYDKVSGPAALVVSSQGLVTWTPDPADLPSTNVVVVRVTDDGEPPLSTTNQFTVIASSVAMAARSSWWIGVDNSPLESPYQPTAELGTPNGLNDAPPGQVTRLPEDPQYVSPPASRDDDYYASGIYPPGYNGLTSYLVVPYDEPFTAWESSLTHNDRTNRFHFRLRDEQTDETGHLQLRFEFTSGNAVSNGVALPGFNEHDVVVRFRNLQGQGTVIYSNRITQPIQITLNFAASEVNASAGANQIEFVRTGPLLSGHTYALAMDYVNLEADADALTDSDGDGLPLAWETDNHLDPTDPADAALDLDGDGLTNLQEYNGGVDSSDPRRYDTDGDGLSDGEERALGTSPNLVDTDGDGLTDAEEVHGIPPTSPLLADTDGDGVWDIVERRLGTNPTSAASKPNLFRGGIGINFVASADPDGRVGTNLPAGRVPQLNWNETFPMPNANKPTGSTADILTPRAGSIVRSDGTHLPNVQVTWSGNNTVSTRNSGSPDSLLMNGMIRASTTVSATVTVNNVPFSQYDVYVVVGAIVDSYRARLRLGSSSSTDRFFRATSTAPQSDFIEILPGSAQDKPGNLVRYSGLTASSFTVDLLSLSGYAVG